MPKPNLSPMELLEALAVYRKYKKAVVVSLGLLVLMTINSAVPLVMRFPITKADDGSFSGKSFLAINSSASVQRITIQSSGEGNPVELSGVRNSYLISADNIKNLPSSVTFTVPQYSSALVQFSVPGANFEARFEYKGNGIELFIENLLIRLTKVIETWLNKFNVPLTTFLAYLGLAAVLTSEDSKKEPGEPEERNIE